MLYTVYVDVYDMGYNVNDMMIVDDAIAVTYTLDTLTVNYLNNLTVISVYYQGIYIVSFYFLN